MDFQGYHKLDLEQRSAMPATVYVVKVDLVTVSKAVYENAFTISSHSETGKETILQLP
jgi:hypothetical protein